MRSAPENFEISKSKNAVFNVLETKLEDEGAKKM